MKIKRIKFNRLRNEEWFNLHTEFKTFVEQVTPEALYSDELFAVFLSFYGNADDLLELIRKSHLSAVIVQLDDVRDRTFRGLHEAILSASHHFDESRRQLAETVLPLFGHYGDLAKRGFNEETASIYNFIQDLRSEKYAPALAALGLTEWGDELERNNIAFEDAILGRNQEAADKSDLKLVDIRRKTDRAYLDIVERIEAAINLHGFGAFEPFVRRLNANIDRYQTLINRRSSSGGKDKPADNPTPAEE